MKEPKRSPNGSEPEKDDPREPCVLLTIHHKQIRAVINTDSQETRIGKNVLALIEKSEKVNPVKKLIKSAYGLELVYTFTVRAGVHGRHKSLIEVVIDQRIPQNEINLGMKALFQLGHRIMVAGQEARYRPVTRFIRRREPKKDAKKTVSVPTAHRKREDSVSDDDKMSFLDEEEAKRIREWSY